MKKDPQKQPEMAKPEQMEMQAQPAAQSKTMPSLWTHPPRALDVFLASRV
jgi:hypothetical protein